MMSNNIKYRDMPFKIPSLKNVPLLAILGMAALLVSSCSTNRQVAEREVIYVQTDSNNEENVAADKNSYYKQYFKTKSQSIEELPEEDVIFTDIEAYSTNESVDLTGRIVIEENDYSEQGYDSWGSNGQDVTVNIYNTGGFGYYGGFYRPWGWGIGNAWGWGGWGFGNAWGWGGFYNPWYCAPFYGGFYGRNWVGHPYYNGGYYGHYGYASNYNRGRSNRNYDRGRSLRGRSSVASRNSNYGRSETARRTSRSNIGRNSRTGVNRSSRETSRTRTTRPSTRTNRAETSRTRTSRPTTRRSSESSRTRTTRPSTRTRSNTRTTRPSTRSNRSVSRPSSRSRSSAPSRSRSSAPSRRGRG